MDVLRFVTNAFLCITVATSAYGGVRPHENERVGTGG
ncbi:hypothetical protein H180DRAFT_00474 [Streptomyces sp. WMMB 322]|nr:hypothetical protein H180DRAFT_00474 [Streptomyces sp. WMMB 322]